MKILNAGPRGVSEMRGKTVDDTVIDSQYIDIIAFILPPIPRIRISERAALSVRPGERQSTGQRWRPRAARDPGDSAFSRSCRLQVGSDKLGRGKSGGDAALTDEHPSKCRRLDGLGLWA